MSIPAWHEEPISRKHDRDSFDCGEEPLNECLRRYAVKNHERGGAKTFVAVADADGASISGFYSVSPVSLDYVRTPEIVKRRLGRYDVPGFGLARLAVSRGVQGKRLGGQLLLAAGRRCLRAASETGGVMLVIDAKNEGVAMWYAHYGAVPLHDARLTLVLPLATIASALKAAGQF
ncbi:MAG TPA: hypothetical protein VFL57_12565 [Bryobacteraceae bacterium]|nr:hypothetical protein [Bryobacteraceae bacterium]